MKTDMQLHQDVLAELMWDPRLGDTEIGVGAKDGVVTLAGTVASYAERLAAEHATERVAGVKGVANDLVVALPAQHERSDTELAHRIVSALQWDIEVPDDAIVATITNGWVTLEGEVEWPYQRDAAARVARGLSGIRGVNNNIKLARKSVSPDEVSQGIKDGAAWSAPGVTEVRDALAVVL